VRGINGKPDSSLSARGSGGFFKSIDSAPFTIIVKDPCSEAVVNSDGRFQLSDPWSVPDGEKLRQKTFLGPTDSVSLANAPSQFDFCGPMSYKL